MPLRVSFHLADEDLRHFEEVAQQTQALARDKPAEAIIAAAQEVLESGERAHVAQFVRARFARLRAIIEMATDDDWRPREDDRQRVLNALACFSVSSSSDAATGVALLDHGIMIELVSRDLERDLEAYHAFRKFREQAIKRRPPSAQQREEWLAQKRSELQTRMRERRRLDLDRVGSSVRKLFSLFGL